MTASHTCSGAVVEVDAAVVTAGDPLEHAVGTAIAHRRRTGPSLNSRRPSDGDNPAPSRERRHGRAEPSELGLGVAASNDRDQYGPHTGPNDCRLGLRVDD